MRDTGSAAGGFGRAWRAATPYAAAVALVAVVAGVRHLLDPVLGDHHPFVLFLAAAFAACALGWRAGALALALGLAAASYLFVAPRGSLRVGDLEHRTGLALYGLVGVAGVLAAEALRRARRRSDDHARRLADEAASHHRTQHALRDAQDALQRRVDQRTAELTAAGGQLRQAEDRVRRLAALAESSEDAIVGVSDDGTVTDWNAGAEHLFGYPAAEAVGRPVFALIPPDERGAAERKLHRLRGGGEVPPYEAVRLRRDGRGVAVSVRLSPVLDGGRVAGFSLIYRDLTGARRVEEQLRQSQKMEAVGQLAGGVAHDFNNLLTVINGYADLLLTDHALGGEARGLVEEVGRAGERAAALTRQLLAFSRRQVVEPRVLDLNDVVRRSERMLRRLIGEDVRLTAALSEGLAPVKADPGQVEQVVMNLAVNARDAMPTGGSLTVETANVELGESYAESHPGVWPGRYVLLAVSDTGCGMTDEVKARVFEPFFTTKGVGRGTGLGLATVFGIVRQAGGHAAVYSEPGRGTTFKIYLPAAESGRPAGRSHAGVVPVPGGSETVLLAEDDAAVRRLAAGALRSAGYEVLEAGHGGEAVQVAESHAGPVHLLVSDVVMPEMGGRALAERVSATRPG